MIIRIIGDDWLPEDKIIQSVTGSQNIKAILPILMKKLDIAKINEYSLRHVSGRRADMSRPALDKSKSWDHEGVAHGAYIYVGKKSDEDAESVASPLKDDDEPPLPQLSVFGGTPQTTEKKPSPPSAPVGDTSTPPPPQLPEQPSTPAAPVPVVAGVVVPPTGHGDDVPSPLGTDDPWARLTGIAAAAPPVVPERGPYVSQPPTQTQPATSPTPGGAPRMFGRQIPLDGPVAVPQPAFDSAPPVYSGAIVSGTVVPAAHAQPHSVAAPVMPSPEAPPHVPAQQPSSVEAQIAALQSSMLDMKRTMGQEVDELAQKLRTANREIDSLEAENRDLKRSADDRQSPPRDAPTRAAAPPNDSTLAETARRVLSAADTSADINTDAFAHIEDPELRRIAEDHARTLNAEIERKRKAVAATLGLYEFTHRDVEMIRATEQAATEQQRRLDEMQAHREALEHTVTSALSATQREMERLQDTVKIAAPHVASTLSGTATHHHHHRHAHGGVSSANAAPSSFYTPMFDRPQSHQSHYAAAPPLTGSTAGGYVSAFGASAYGSHSQVAPTTGYAAHAHQYSGARGSSVAATPQPTPVLHRVSSFSGSQPPRSPTTSDAAASPVSHFERRHSGGGFTAERHLPGHGVVPPALSPIALDQHVGGPQEREVLSRRAELDRVFGSHLHSSAAEANSRLHDVRHTRPERAGAAAGGHYRQHQPQPRMKAQETRQPLHEGSYAQRALAARERGARAAPSSAKTTAYDRPGAAPQAYAAPLASTQGTGYQSHAAELRASPKRRDSTPTQTTTGRYPYGTGHSQTYWAKLFASGEGRP